MKYSILILLVFNCIFSQAPTVGLLYHDSAKAYQGYTLFAPNTSTTTYLIDMDGRLVHNWESDYVPKLSAYLLENGNLLRSAAVSSPPNNTLGGFQLFEWDNTLIWEYHNGDQHHDIEYINKNGNVLLILDDAHAQNETINGGRDPNSFQETIRSLSIIEVKQTGLNTGDIVWRWNAWDHIIQDFDGTKANFGVVKDHPELIDINYYTFSGQDWLHTNSIDYSEDLDQIVISNRNTNEIWIIDHSTTTEEAASHAGGNSGKGGDLLYRWGNPESYNEGTVADRKLHGQHDAHWIEGNLSGAGNLLIFNNGYPLLTHSSVIEIKPPLDNGIYIKEEGPYSPIIPVWQYIATPIERFLSPRYGGAQRLPNGNTLICNSESGEFIEVTTSGEIVWQYINPITSTGPLVQGTEEIGKNQVFRCYRFGPDYPAFSGKDLTPGNPIELYNVAVEDEINNISAFRLKQNHPNPFNPNTNIEFELGESSYVTLTIYDIMGNEIRTLLNQRMESGVKNISWDSLDNSGNPVSSGMYFYTITTGEAKQTKKMLLLR